jgi:hypothetical protein
VGKTRWTVDSPECALDAPVRGATAEAAALEEARVPLMVSLTGRGHKELGMSDEISVQCYEMKYEQCQSVCSITN